MEEEIKIRKLWFSLGRGGGIALALARCRLRILKRLEAFGIVVHFFSVGLPLLSVHLRASQFHRARFDLCATPWILRGDEGHMKKPPDDFLEYLMEATGPRGPYIINTQGDDSSSPILIS
jgi:hypothetical protein